MQTRPPTPTVSDAPDRLFEEGHLWVLEQIDGVSLRFQLREAGYLRFGDGERLYDDRETVPAYHRPAVRHVRKRLDRDALRAAVDDVESVVLFGVTPVSRRVDYDLSRVPPFLGTDIWDGEAFLTPDAVDGGFERLGLESVNAVAREVRARDFDPESYAVPESAWADEPAAGVVVRNKRGDRAVVEHPDQTAERVADADGATELAARYGTDDRLEAAATTLDDRDRPVTVDALVEQVLGELARVEYQTLYGDDPVDEEAFGSALARRAGEFLGDRDT